MEKQLSELQKTLWKNKKFLALVVASILILAFASSLGLSTISYTTAYQGAQPSFSGVQWGSHTYTNGQIVPNGGFISITGTTMSFNGGKDPATGKKYPTITGQMTSVFIPTSDTVGDVPTWAQTITSWLTGWSAATSSNADPTNTYTWTNGNNEYIMKEYTTEWFVTFGSDNTGEIRYGDNTFSPTNPAPLIIWMNLQTNTGGWYISGDGLQSTSFAIAKILVGGYTRAGHNPSNVGTTPSAVGGAMSCFLNNFGNSAAPTETQVLNSAQGTLNPTYFNSGVYTNVYLGNFGTQEYGTGFLGLVNSYSGDTVAWQLSVSQFVVGNWLVQDIQKPPTTYITPTISNQGWGGDLLNGLFGWLNNPFDLFLILLLIIGAGVIILIVFFPELAKALSGAASRKINSGAAKKKSG